MTLEEFTLAMQQAGWRPKSDAQHEGAERLWRRIFQPDSEPEQKTCKYEGCSRPAKPGGEFCSAVHRAAWNRENKNVIAARVQSVSRTREGAHVVVVRVQAEESHRIKAILPTSALDLLERPEA